MYGFVLLGGRELTVTLIRFLSSPTGPSALRSMKHGCLPRLPLSIIRLAAAGRSVTHAVRRLA